MRDRITGGNDGKGSVLPLSRLGLVYRMKSRIGRITQVRDRRELVIRAGPSMALSYLAILPGGRRGPWNRCLSSDAWVSPSV
jgi:hypothetical protein